MATSGGTKVPATFVHEVKVIVASFNTYRH